MDEYEKKYKEAMARLELVTRTGLELDPTYIFPELAESEDEKIRKVLLNYFQHYSQTFCDVPTKDIIAWLEKQSEQKHANDTDEDIVEAVKDTFIPDIVESTFHEGDFIVNKDDNTYKVVDVVENEYRLRRLSDNGFVQASVSVVDRQSHLWTIQDAKDGDVLAADVIESHPSPFVAICKKQDGELFETYCFIGHDGKFYKGEIGHAGEYVHPATKEQRKLLFQKMKEAGYEWDADKKKFKEFNPDDLIEESYQQQADDLIDMVTEKSNWSEDDEEKFRDVIRLIEQSAPVQSMRDHYANWLKLLKDRVQPQPKQEWSEEDEHRVKDTIYFLETAKKHYASEVELNACIDWLETLKKE